MFNPICSLHYYILAHRQYWFGGFNIDFDGKDKQLSGNSKEKMKDFIVLPKKEKRGTTRFPDYPNAFTLMRSRLL